MRILLPVLAGLTVGISPPALAKVKEFAPAQQVHVDELDAAIAHPSRIFDRRRDTWRHPRETLEFFRVEPGMTVVDYMPAKGWYTRVLVPFLGPNGRYLGTNPAPAGQKKIADFFAREHAKFSAMASQWSLEGAKIEALTSADLSGSAGSVDRVLIFREMHNLHATGALKRELGAIRKALKDDGLLGIVQHRAPESASRSYADGNKGYMRQSDVIKLVEKQGFALVTSSEINANAADPANHAVGVWALPPVWRSRDARIRAIGESDRMTLLFAKR